MPVIVATILLVAAVALGLAWLSFEALRRPAAAPDRLVIELRLAQLGAAVLILTAGAQLGLAVAHEHVPGAAYDVALAFGFFAAAVAASLREPREALTFIALAFVAHAVVDTLHQPGWLPEIAPRWYLVGCGVYDVLVGVICYLPVYRS